MGHLLSGIVAAALSAGGVYLIWRGRRRGRRWALGMTAAALLPFGLWASGVARLLWRLADAAVEFLTSLVFSPLVWAGFVTLGVAALVGLLAVRTAPGAGRSARTTQDPLDAVRRGATPAPGKPAVRKAPARPSGKPAGDDLSDFGDIEDILKRRGIS